MGRPLVSLIKEFKSGVRGEPLTTFIGIWEKNNEMGRRGISADARRSRWSRGKGKMISEFRKQAGSAVSGATVLTGGFGGGTHIVGISH